VGLDQRVRRWQLALKDKTASRDADAYGTTTTLAECEAVKKLHLGGIATSGSGNAVDASCVGAKGQDVCLEYCEVEKAVTQVLEPAALHALSSDSTTHHHNASDGFRKGCGGDKYCVAIVGRGCQTLKFEKSDDASEQSGAWSSS